MKKDTLKAKKTDLKISLNDLLLSKDLGFKSKP